MKMWKDYIDGTYGNLKEELERTYGLFIFDQAIYSANFLIQTRAFPDYCHEETMEEKMRRVLSEACDLTLSNALNKKDETDFDLLLYMLHRGFVERNEIIKEKDEASKDWLLLLEEELEMAKWIFPKFVQPRPINSGFFEMVQKMNDTSHSLYLALETVDISQISNLLSELLENIHTYLQMSGKKYYHVMGVGKLAVEEVVSRLTGIPKDYEFEHELSALIDYGLFSFEEREKLPLSKTLARLIVRDIARSVNERGMVVYPTNAALNLLIRNDSIHDKDDCKKWLAENMVPKLSEIAESCKVEDEIYTVYVDTLVGSSELSFRLEKESGKNIVENWFSKKALGPLRKLRAIYSLDREVIDLTLKLKIMCFQLMGNLNDGTLIRALKDFLISYQKSLSSMQHGPKLGNNIAAKQGVTLINNRQTKAVKNGVQCLVRNLRARVKGQKHATIRIITLSILRSIKSPYNPPNKPAGVYLSSGLDNARKINFFDDVDEYLRVIEGIPHLIQVDLSNELNSDSLLFSSTSKSALSVVEAVRRWPYCVVVFDKIEKADALVYSTLLRILDTGILHCVDGSMVDFRNTTIIFTTDLGKKDLCLGLFGYSRQYAGCSKDGIQQDGPRFRTELLRRLDDILWADSKSREEMKFLRFSIIKSRVPLFPEREPKNYFLGL